MRKIALSDLPQEIQEMPDAPSALFIQGELPEGGIYLTVVGSRRNTAYGREACQKIISELSGYPFVIVSGLAIGMDAIAHKAAIDASLPTIAVPGSGLSEDVLYPRSNVFLARQILEKDGALISEFPGDTKAQSHHFPMRNRIMAGLSQGTLIIEAQEKSGSLITARLALEYNRHVLAVPGPIFSDTSKGTNNLIKEGATPVTSGLDILNIFNMKEKKREVRVDLDEGESAIFSVLSSPLSKDDLIRKTKLPTRKVNEIVTQLEIKGLVKIDTEKIYRLR